MASGRTVHRIVAVQYQLINKLRDRRAFDVAARTPSDEDFSSFKRARQCLLVTYRRSGEPVPSPVNYGLGEDGKLYIRTDGNSAKVKRVRANPQVVVVPCGLRGTPRGPGVRGTARILPPSEEARADAIIASNWSPAMKVLERGLDKAANRFDMPIVYVEITSATAAG